MAAETARADWGARLRPLLPRYVPIVRWLPAYPREALRPDLIGEERIEREQKLPLRKLQNGAESEDIRFANCGLVISNLKRQSGTVTLALD